MVAYLKLSASASVSAPTPELLAAMEQGN